MSERTFNSELFRLTEQKTRLKHQIDCAYEEMDLIYHELSARFEKLYPNYTWFDTYEITTVDFWFGSIACEYTGNNYDLSDKLFEINRQLEDVDVFELKPRQLIKIYNILVLLCNDVCCCSFFAIHNPTTTANDILNKIKELIDFVSINRGNLSQELENAIQKFYTLLDFALHDDVDIYDDLRVLRQQYIDVQTASYEKIEVCEEEIRLIDDKLENLQEQMAYMERYKTQAEPTSQEKPEKKEEKPNKFITILVSIPLSILGALGVHLFYGITFFIISLVFLLISYIPIIKNIVGYLLAVGDNTPDGFAMFVATMVAYFGFIATAERIVKKTETRKLTLILTGIFLTVSNVLYVIINLIYRDPILGSVLLSIAGIVIFCKGKNIQKEEI